LLKVSGLDLTAKNRYLYSESGVSEMNRFSFPFFLVLIFFFSTLILAENMPKIFVPQVEWDFGKVPQGGIVSHKYWIKNQGTKVLHIIRVRPGCGCTQAPLEKLFVPPGDSTKVELVFNSFYYPGKSKKGATIVSTDSITGDIRISFTVEVLPNFDSIYPVYVHPCSLTFKSNLTKQEMKIKNVSKKKLKLEIVDSPDEFYKPRLTKDELASGKSCKLKIENKKELPMEGSFKSITLEVVSDTTYRFSLPIRWIGWDKEKK
jgi:hypothetical protein